MNSLAPEIDRLNRDETMRHCRRKAKVDFYCPDCEPQADSVGGALVRQQKAVEMAPKTEMGKRLADAREKAGFSSARRAGNAFGWKLSTYAAHENGQNHFGPGRAEEYASAFGVSPGWLLTGICEPTSDLRREASTKDPVITLLEAVVGTRDEVGHPYDRKAAPGSGDENSLLREIIRRLDDQVRDLREERDAWRSQAQAKASNDE